MQGRRACHQCSLRRSTQPAHASIELCHCRGTRPDVNDRLVLVCEPSSRQRSFHLEDSPYQGHLYVVQEFGVVPWQTVDLFKAKQAAPSVWSSPSNSPQHLPDFVLAAV